MSPQYNNCVIQHLAIIVSVAASLFAAEVPAGKAAVSPEAALKLAESGQCAAALPLLKKSLARSADPAQARRLGLDAVRCAMSLNEIDAAGDFVSALKKQFPKDPEVLYVAAHVFSELSVRSSRELSGWCTDSRL